MEDLPRPQVSQTAKAASLRVMEKLNLSPHPEGGFFRRTDTNPSIVPNPFSADPNATKNASSSIMYLLPPHSPVSRFHRNKSRTYFTALPTGPKTVGRVLYIVIHADEVEEGSGGYARVETFVAGGDLEGGDRLQWVIPGGKYKAAYLIDDGGDGEGAGGLISEVVVPAFEFADHDFLTKERLYQLVGPDVGRKLEFLVLEKAVQ